MTIPLLLNDDFLIRKYRIDEEQNPTSQQYFLGEDGKKYPELRTALRFPSPWKKDEDNSISLYVEDLLARLNVPVELLVETFTIKNEPDNQYGLFRVSIEDIYEVYGDLINIVYDYDSEDPIAQRGLCHILISLKDMTESTYNKKRKKWSASLHVLNTKRQMVSTNSMRFT